MLPIDIFDSMDIVALIGMILVIKVVKRLIELS